MRHYAAFCLLSAVFCLPAGRSLAQKAPVVWQKLDEGLELAEIKSPVLSSINNSVITVLKINPVQYDFVMLNAKAGDKQLKTIDKWCDGNGLVAGVNAGMFKLDWENLTGTGYTKNYKHVNNPTLNGKYKTILAFNPVQAGVPPMQLIDLTVDNWAKLKTQYHTFSQGLRVVGPEGQGTWAPAAKKWSMVLWGVDKAGNALWIFTRSPYQVAAFADILLSLNLDIRRIMYLEGGPEASFYLNHPERRLNLMGSYETGFNENDKNDEFWKLPNVIGIRKR